MAAQEQGGNGKKHRRAKLVIKALQGKTRDRILGTMETADLPHVDVESIWR